MSLHGGGAFWKYKDSLLRAREKMSVNHHEGRHPIVRSVFLIGFEKRLLPRTYIQSFHKGQDRDRLLRRAMPIQESQGFLGIPEANHVRARYRAMDPTRPHRYTGVGPLLFRRHVRNRYSLDVSLPITRPATSLRATYAAASYYRQHETCDLDAIGSTQKRWVEMLGPEICIFKSYGCCSFSRT